jgi:Putative esterase/C-terminal binding-module, SLH-like, of glucodextranase
MGLLVAGAVAIAPASAGATPPMKRHMLVSEPEGPSLSSLYHGPAPRPGPSILYRKPASSPQLANRGIWHAKPILVSGTSAYRKGEFLYQDFLYDDHGARGSSRDPGDPREAPGGHPEDGDVFAQPNGTYTYPTARKYGNNAADLVEFRVKPLARSTAFRITLNTMKDPSLVGTTIALGSSKQPREFPHGANATAPARLFLTVHGRHADLRRASTGKIVRPAPRVSTSKRRRQIQVQVSHRAWNPRERTVRVAAGVGLWDRGAHRYLIPGTSADATHPGGAAGLSDPTAFFNVAFRFGEPWQHGFGSDSVFDDPAWWRDREQGNALAQGHLSPFFARVSFRKLRDGITDEMHGKPSGVPTRGPMDRILVSHFETEQGADYSKACGSPTDCQGELRGRLQPYAIYLPKGPRPRQGYGLTLLLHSLNTSYNQFAATNNQSQLGERGPGSIVITPSGRGLDGWYWGHAGADTFEVWADVARRYRLDPRWTAISGYSMGGYGTYKLAAQYPDLFARANPVVGPPGLGIWVPPAPPLPGGDESNTNRMLGSVRNIPFLIWDGTLDELVPVAGAVYQAQTFDDLGYRYTFDLFTVGDHAQLAVNDQYAPAAKFLGTHKVDRNPPHVTYVVNPKMNFRRAGTVANHAYWLSGLRLRDASGSAPLGKVDARSAGFGRGDPVPGPTQHSAGVLTGGSLGAMPFTEQSKSWGKAPKTRRRNLLHLKAENLSRVVIHPQRARLTCHPKLDVTTDGPLSVTLAGCGRTLRFHP